MAELHRQFEEAGGSTAFYSRVEGGSVGGAVQRLAHIDIAQPGNDPLVEQHGLNTLPYEKLVGWWFGDFVFNTEFDMVSDMGKIRRAGFTEAVETEATIVRAIERLRANRQLP
jgi:hypothetical protein